MTTRDLLFVAWQDAESRRIVPIGRLLRRDGRYEFAYVNAVSDARALGFEALLTYPDLEEVYESRDLPPLFSNRLLPKRRPELAEYLGELGLAVEQGEPFTVLSRSGGRRTTDQLEVFAPPEQMNDGGYQGLFLARGVRHVPGSESALAQLGAASPLFVMADVQNSTNSAALALRDGAQHLLGYVPDYLANELVTAGASPALLQVTAERINLPPAPVHHRLLCRFRMPGKVGGNLFRGEGYQPLSPKAAATAA